MDARDRVTDFVTRGSESDAVTSCTARRPPGPSVRAAPPALRDHPDAPSGKAGRFYTTANPFRHPAFLDWAGAAGLPEARLVEPFAGSNRLVRFLDAMELCRDFRAYDLEPADPRVRRRDTLASFPVGFPVCVTNPPWLARNSATFRGLDFPDCAYPDLYLHCLDRCLRHCRFVAALVPESFLRAGVRFAAFRSRLLGFVSLTARLRRDRPPDGARPLRPRPGRRRRGLDGRPAARLVADARTIAPGTETGRAADALQRSRRPARSPRPRRYARALDPLL